jgi:glycosyltransferase involved in cell wall biosynthesis
MTNNKLVIISRSFAPMVIGTPVLLSNLFSSYKAPVEALAGWLYDAKVDPAFTPPCPSRYLRMPHPFLQRVFDRYVNKMVPLIEWYLSRSLKEIKPTVVLATCPSGEFFTAAWRACKKLGIPFWAHMHDLWEENIPENSQNKTFARKWEAEILPGAHTVFCMTGIQQTHYEKKYPGIRTALLPHTIRPDRLSFPPVFRTEKISQKKKWVIYSGNISDNMNLDAVQQFVRAVDLLPDWVGIKMFVSWNEDLCKRKGIWNQKIHYDWLPMEAANREVAAANLLFLPLSFKNAAMEEVRTVFATKTLDYLTSGTPILVYSPANSFHTISAGERGWGHIVVEDSPEAIVQGILQVIENEELSRQLVEGAWKEACSRSADTYARQLEMQVASFAGAVSMRTQRQQVPIE